MGYYSGTYVDKIRNKVRILSYVVAILCMILVVTVVRLNVRNTSDRVSMQVEYGMQITDLSTQLVQMTAEYERWKEYGLKETSRADKAERDVLEYQILESSNAKLFKELRALHRKAIENDDGSYIPSTNIDGMAQISRGSVDRGERQSRGNTRVTAYSLAYKDCEKSPSDKGYGITASGNEVKDNYTIAAGKNIPFGTKVFIPELREWSNGGVFTVEDRGGAIKDNCIDIFIRDTKASDKFGLQYINTYIMSGGFE